MIQNFYPSKASVNSYGNSFGEVLGDSLDEVDIARAHFGILCDSHGLTLLTQTSQYT
jgi:hypothetical protein